MLNNPLNQTGSQTQISKDVPMVTRRVTISTVYEIYSNEKGTLTKLDTITVKGKPNQKELCEKYGVKDVVCVKIEENKKVYGVPVEEFMKIAVEVER